MDRTDASQRDPAINPGTVGANDKAFDAAEMRLLAIAAVARHHGYDLDRSDYHLDAGEQVPSPASLVTWLRNGGLVAKASRVAWPQLMRLATSSGGGPAAPVALLFSDGSAGVLVGADPARIAEQGLVNPSNRQDGA